MEQADLTNIHFPGIHDDGGRAMAWQPSRFRPELKEGLWYLATVYTQHPRGFHQAWVDSCQMAADLLRGGVKIFCPISHSHGMAIFGGIDGKDHDIWMPLDIEFVRVCRGMIVVESENWRKSKGIAIEVHQFQQLSRPIYSIPFRF